MAPVTMPPVEEARSIFSRLGYTVSGSGTEMVAERKWRTVEVTALTGEEAQSTRLADVEEAAPRFRCFVTWKEYTGDLRERLARTDTAYEWAIIGVDRTGNYDVVRDGQRVPA